MRSIYLLVIFTVVSFSATAQSSAKDSITATIHSFFKAMKDADTALLQTTLMKDALLQTIKNTGGKTTVANEPIADFIAFLATQRAGDADERIKVGDVQSDGVLASVWTPYQFYYKGKFSHCGVNSFQLVRDGGNWKIQYIIDTRRKTGCN